MTPLGLAQPELLDTNSTRATRTVLLVYVSTGPASWRPDRRPVQVGGQPGQGSGCNRLAIACRPKCVQPSQADDSDSQQARPRQRPARGSLQFTSAGRPWRQCGAAPLARPRRRPARCPAASAAHAALTPRAPPHLQHPRRRRRGRRPGGGPGWRRGRSARGGGRPGRCRGAGRSRAGQGSSGTWRPCWPAAGAAAVCVWLACLGRRRRPPGSARRL